MKIKEGDAIRLRQSLKANECYGGLTFLKGMDYRPSRIIVITIDCNDNSVLARGTDDLEWWYSASMLDIRTLRKACNEHIRRQQI